MPTIKIAVRNKVAKSPDDIIVCGNNDYIIDFDFDEEWKAYSVKTARFIYNGTYEDVSFSGNKVVAPIVKNASVVEIGVYAGDLRTTTPALLSCEKSIICKDGTPAAPAPDVYAQLMEIFKAGRVYDAKINTDGHLIITLENGEEFDAGYCCGSSGGGGGSFDVDQTYKPESENAQSGKAVSEAISAIPQPIKYIESPPDGDLVNFRDLETGTYILHGYFSPYANSDISIAATNAFTIVYTTAAGTHLVCINAKNSVVNFMEILADETAEKGYTYTRTNISLMELYGLIDRVTTLETQTGDIETALDSIITIQNSLIGGDSE